MTNNNVLNNNNGISSITMTKINWIADPEQRQIVETTMKAANITFEWIMPKIKTTLMIDATTGLATCPACGKQFDVNTYDIEMQKQAHANGLCKDCIEQYQKIKSFMKNSSTKSSNGMRAIKDGGQAAGERIRAAFKFAVDNNTLTDEILQNMQNKVWTKENLKISSYAFLKDITGFSAKQIKFARIENDSNGKARYLSTVYNINGKQYIMTNSLFSKNLATIDKVFKTLGILPADYAI